jgi:hypothetical protein
MTGRRYRRGLSQVRLHIENLEERTIPAVDLALLASQIDDAVQLDYSGVTGARDGPMARAGYDLTRLYHEFQAYTCVLGEPAGSFVPSSSLLQTAGGWVAVEVLTALDPAAARFQLDSLGFAASSQSSYSYSGWLPITSLDEVVALPGVRAIAPSYRSVSSVGLVDSQGHPAQQSDLLARFLGLDGSGISIGVLSVSYNVLGGA